MSAPPAPKASAEELHRAGIPLAYRDHCAHLLIPLNICRRKEYFLPWKCEHEKHHHEVCEYRDFLRRHAAVRDRKPEGAAPPDLSAPAAGERIMAQANKQ